MAVSDLYELLRQAIWDGRWLAIQAIWSAVLTNPWILIVLVAAIAIKGRRGPAGATRWLGMTLWRHSEQ